MDFSQPLADQFWDSFKGDPTAAIQSFEQGYLATTGNSSFSTRCKAVLIGAALALTSVPAQIIQLFAKIILGEGDAWRSTKKLVHTAFVIPVGAVLGVVFFFHYLGIELPKDAYRSCAT